MKKVLISIRPEWVAKILNGEKTLEIRKSAPKDLPCEVYIYCTKGNPSISPFEFYESGRPPHIIGGEINGKVVAKFTLNKTYLLTKEKIGYVAWAGMGCFKYEKDACITKEQLDKYLNGKDGYAWLIDDLKIFDEPKELKEFGLRRAPQSWQYIEAEVEE